MGSLSAVVFDLYGTLLHFDQREFLRDLRASLGTSTSRLSGPRLRELLVAPRADSNDDLHAWCAVAGAITPTRDQLDACKAVLDRHRDSVSVVEGARSLIAFLRRRGLKIGLLSNASAEFKLPFARFLEPSFDAALFSCDIGAAKPCTEVYLEIANRLEIAPEYCLFVGDSFENDYKAPRACGMRALHLGELSHGPDHPSNLVEMSWIALDGPGLLRRLVRPGTTFLFGGEGWTVTEFDGLPDAAQGRHNVVARLTAKSSLGNSQTFYCKRFGDAVSAHVEDTAYRLLELWGANGCRADVIPGTEPLLAMTPVVGAPWSAEATDEATAQAVGRHCAFAYIIGNADLRPRNTFVVRHGGTVQLFPIDLEHCFFDRAVQLRPHEDPFAPDTIDSLRGSLEERTRTRVVSPAGCRRTRRSFLPVEDKAHPLARAYLRGSMEAFSIARSTAGDVEALLLSRAYGPHPLVIGTQSYRRAMARIDVEDILSRAHQDPNDFFERTY